MVVSIAGNLIFKLFGISLATLRITGGIVLFIIGYQMLQGASSHSHKPSDADVAESKDSATQCGGVSAGDPRCSPVPARSPQP